jgi:hypothetical protein
LPEAAGVDTVVLAVFLRVVLVASFAAACGGSQPPSGRPEGGGARTAPLAPQAGYCERLAPLLEQSTKAADIGAKLACLDVPGVTELGRFGGGSNAEEEALANCFERREDFASVVAMPEGTIELRLDDEFVSEAGARAGARLGDLVPWLPSVSVANDKARRVRARISIENARFVTLVGVASKLQGQPREAACLQALCMPGTTYVSKALVGTPKVVLSAEDEHGQSAAIGAVLGNAGFSDKQLDRGRRELSSVQPVTLAIARTSFRTPQTERLCRLCGRKGQACCAEGPACDGGLGCVGAQCVAVGGPGQPCDGESCVEGAACVKGRCEASCGRKASVCCAGNLCAHELRCVTNPQNFDEKRVTSDDFSAEGGFFGTDEDRVLSSASCGPAMQRSRFAVTKVGSGRGSCERAWWFDPENEYDCRTAVHVGVSPFGNVSCRVEVFAFEPPKPNLCMP